ncbi:MAG: acyl-CoA dehydrogenase family protein [Mycobacteriales bacterium]
MDSVAMDRFAQTFPPLPDVYVADHVLRSHLDRLLGEAGHKEAAPLLEALAADVAGPLRAAHRQAESHPPELVRYGPWGERVDRIETPEGWQVQRRAAARHGLVALPYEQAARERWGAGARVVQHALLHLYGPESATFSCPVAMSDGAAFLLSEPDVDMSLKSEWLSRLLARDGTAITSGQWMTETTGGSDVGRTGTTARRSADGWRLTGEKWFCSAIDSAMSIALARPEGAPAGSRGLACFLVPRYADHGYAGGPDGATAPGLRIHRLKDKLGTRALPSAEVGLRDALGFPVGDPARPGLSRMMRLASVTRLHNAAAAAAGMRRGLLYVRNHAAGREAFGVRLEDSPLHRETLAWLAVDAEAAFALAGLGFHLLGRAEAGEPVGPLLRLVGTLAKAFTGRLAVASASEYVECFGGNGYIEDTGVPRLLRDAQVLPIWEGTTNVLSLDVLRALAREADALPAYLAYVDGALDTAAAAGLGAVAELVRPVRDEVAGAAASAAAGAGEPATQAGARTLMTRMAGLLAAAALLEQAVFEAGRADRRAELVAALWARRRLRGEPRDGDGHAGFDHLVDGASR